MTTISNDLWREKPPIQLGDASAVSERLRRPLLGALRGVCRVFRAAIRAWRAHRAIRALEALDDRMLRDIGMARSEITYRVRLHKTAEW